MTLAASRSTRRHLSRLCPDRGNPEVKVENRTYQYLYDPTAADNFRFADDPPGTGPVAIPSPPGRTPLDVAKRTAVFHGW